MLPDGSLTAPKGYANYTGFSAELEQHKDYLIYGSVIDKGDTWLLIFRGDRPLRFLARNFIGGVILKWRDV